MVDNKISHVERCLETFANVVGFNIIEIWMHSAGGVSLANSFIDTKCALIAPYVEKIAEYHNGERENTTSRSLCKRAMQSKSGFSWIAREDKRMHPEIPVHTAVAFHMPRDNICTDVFIIGYSLRFIKFSQPKLDFVFWQSHSICVVAFGGADFDDPYNETTGETMNGLEEDMVTNTVPFAESITPHQVSPKQSQMSRIKSYAAIDGNMRKTSFFIADSDQQTKGPSRQISVNQVMRAAAAVGAQFSKSFLITDRTLLSTATEAVLLSSSNLAGLVSSPTELPPRSPRPGDDAGGMFHDVHSTGSTTAGQGQQSLQETDAHVVTPTIASTPSTEDYYQIDSHLEDNDNVSPYCIDMADSAIGDDFITR